MLATHCLAHRMELAFKAASPKLYEKTMTLLIGLYYLYRSSPTQKKALKIKITSKIFYCGDVQSVKNIVTLGTYQRRKLNFI